MNSAQRILKVVIAIRAQRRSSADCLPVWMDICSRLYGDNNVDQHRIAYIFSELNEEVGLLIEELQDRDLPESIYRSYLDQFRTALQPTKLNGSWAGCVGNVTIDTENILQWIALYLGEQEDPIDQDDLDELISNLRGIDALIAEPGLPRALKRIIKNNVDAIWEAIDLYPIRGAAGLEDAIKRAAGDLTFNQSEVESALASENDTSRTATASILQAIKATVTIFNSTVKSGENVIKVGSAVSELFKLS